MRTLVGKRLPKFSKEESRELKGSFDFLGLNYYSSYYVVDAPHRHNAAQPAIKIDSLINATFEHNGKPLGQMVCISSFHWKITYISMLFICRDEFNDPTLSLEESLLDTYRIDYYYRHLYYLETAIRDDFRDYAELCFKEFGDRVKHWITINEPWSVSMNAYAFGKLAPSRCSDWLNLNCTGGDSGTEPYLTAHNQLLAHSAVANLYRIKYKLSQRGIIGITLVSYWYEPATTAKADVDASKRGLDFMFGWYMNPLTRGEYPKSMRTLVGKRLPKFSKEESRELKGSFDFLGLNYYSSYYAADAPHRRNAAQPAIQTDSLINATFEHNGKPLGPMSASSWLCIYPKGFKNLLLYTKKTYEDPVIYITENGRDEFNDPTLSLEESLLDTYRIDYYYRHLYYLETAIKDGVNVKGYFAWSLLDNFEWDSGLSLRFGLVFVDFFYELGLKFKRTILFI
ncbi:hypothetical protein KIW84_013603 [Lathyrus oleraceus]|uniref:Uncharacterized protein n=1 Tax=Pisum sativum TaxID=3888 RepID=A0A9D5GY18_PEA|nr:hypothetical protein KIW84_013603 [Pisum sativum]